MDEVDESNDVVHPEVRAHVNSLVSALGGFSADDDGRYVLGDSAIEVLRDIKKWIRFYDEKTNRMDVARCLADANLVGGDLLHILASWPENATDNKFKYRAALACFEILVPLTWPLDRDPAQMTVNHHRHQPILHLAQLRYKRDIVNFDAARILHTAVRVALPSLALDRNERTSRDESLIKIVLLFLRNVAQIAPQPNSSHDSDDSYISRSSLIDAFSYQDILLTILTLASNMGDDFNHEGVILLEILFHLVKRVDVNKLFMDDKQLNKTKSNELTAMMNKEAAMHRPYNRKAPTRHNRWGAMVWVDRGDGKVSTVSGQDALLDSATRQHKMDSTKVFRPPRRPKDQLAPQDLGLPVSLNTRARQQLKDFVSEFLDSGFNPLFTNVRKKIDEQKDYVFDYHSRQFFYLVSWFLEAERIRQKSNKKAAPAEADEVKSFNLVAGVLNQETFITLNRSIGEAMESKNWTNLCAAMRCFTQILLTVQDMSESGNEDDEEIAENILSRIFYEEETHDRVANIARSYKDQGFEYLDACTELTHTYLRVLEAYSKQNVDMQVHSKRRVRKKKKAAKAAGEAEGEDPVPEDESENDQADAEKVSRERKFDFTRFTARFVVQGVVDTFTAFTKFYQDLDDSQLKRAHRYFYRVAFKHEMSVMLFRVDIIQLFHGMIKGQSPLDRASGMYKEWEELSKQILRKCIRKIEDRPQLIIEMLFSKISATAHYLEFGHEKQTVTSTQTKPAAELEFRRALEPAQQIGVAVGVLLDKNLAHHVKWVKDQLNKGISERTAWEAAEKAMPATENGDGIEGAESAAQAASTKEAPLITLRPEDDARRTAVFKNGHLRLLMKLVGFERLETISDETPESLWIIPSHLTVEALQNSLDHIAQAEFDPPSFENGLLAEHQLRRKTAPRKKAAFDDDGDDLPSDDDDILFPAGGPTTRKDTAEKSKKKRVRRRRGSNAEEPSEEQLEERARERRDREREKALRFKSDLYVHASDDESGDEDRWADFYANEDRIRRMQQEVAERAARGFGADDASKKKPAAKAQKASKKQGTKKRKARKAVLSDDDDDEEEGDGKSGEDDAASTAADDESEASATPAPAANNGADDTPLSSSPRSSSGGSRSNDAAAHKRRRLSPEGDDAVDAGESQDNDVSMGNTGGDGEEEEDDAPVPQPPKRRPRGKAGFIVDSSDEE